MASISYVVNATDAASTVFAKIAASADSLDKQLEDLGKRVAEPSVDLQDSKFTIGMLNAAKRLDKLSAMVATPGVEVDTGKAQLEILRISAMLDRLDAKRVSVDVGVHRAGFFSRTSSWGGLGRTLAGLLPGVSGAAGGAGGAAGQVAPAAASGAAKIFSNPYTATAAVAVGLASLPFIAQAAAGGITLALGGALTGIGVISAAQSKKVRADWTALFGNAVAELHQVTAPFIGVLKQISQVGQSVLPSIMMELVGPMKILAPAFKTFSDALLRTFTQPAVAASLQSVAKAFGSILKALAPQLATDIRDVAVGIERIANTVARNPGAFAAVISFFFKATGFALSMVSALANVANYIEKHFIPALIDIRNGVGDTFHWIAGHFDTWRHWWANAWDQLFQNTIGALIRFGHNVEAFFSALPGRILAALRGLGHQLAAFASAAMNEMWNGIKNVGSGILGWFGGFVSKIVGFFSRLLHHSPTGDFYHMGRNMMEGLAMGLKDHAHLVANAAQRAVAGAAGAAGGGGSVAALGRGMAAAFGWTGAEWTALNNVAMRESGWSTTARNPSSGAYGIAQFINGPSEYYQYGGNPATAAGQITGFLNYVSQRYGDPIRAWQHELSFGWYDWPRAGSSRYLPTGLSLALNTTGRPEPVGGGSGITINNLTITLPPGSDQQQGRKIVEYIRSFEKGSGAGWRS